MSFAWSRPADRCSDLEIEKRASVLRVCMATCAFLFAAGCGAEGEQSVGEIEVSEAFVLFAETGDTRRVSATALDEAGTPIGIEATWRSLDPDVVSVSSDGLVTSEGFGTGVVVAEVPAEAHGGATVVAKKVRVTTAELAPGTAIVTPDQLLSDVEVVSAPAAGELFGAVLRVLVDSEATGLDVGNKVIASDWGFMGTVLDAEPSAGGTLLTAETSRLEGAFTNLDLNYRFTLEDFDFGDPGAPEAATAGVTPKSAAEIQVVTGLFQCDTEAAIGLTGVTTDIVPEVQIENPEYSHSEIVSAGLTIGASDEYEIAMRVNLSGVIGWTPDLSGSISCQFTAVAPVVGVGPLIVALPIGFGFDIDVGASTTPVTAVLEGYADVTMRFGIEYSLTNGFEGIRETEIDTDNFDVQYEFADLTNSDADRANLGVELYAFIKPLGGVGIGAQAGVLQTLEDNRVGVKAAADLAGRYPQVRDDNYAAKVDMSVFGRHTAKDPLLTLRPNIAFLFPTLALDALDALGIIDLEELASWELQAPVATTPRGILVASDLETQEGAEVTLALDLEQTQAFGSYQPTRVDIVRVEGEGPSATTTAFKTAVAEPGQTHFEWIWEPSSEDADEGIVRLAAFVHSALVPGIPLQADEVVLEILVDSNSCDEAYSGVPGYINCGGVAAGQCKFFVILNQVASCDDMCEAGGGTCIQALRDEDSCIGTEPRPCDDPANDRVCVCTQP